MTSPIENRSMPSLEKCHLSDIDLYCPLCQLQMLKYMEIPSFPQYGYNFNCKKCKIWIFEIPLQLIFQLEETAIIILPSENIMRIANPNLFLDVNPFYLDFSDLSSLTSYVNNIILLS